MVAGQVRKVKQAHYQRKGNRSKSLLFVGLCSHSAHDKFRPAPAVYPDSPLVIAPSDALAADGTTELTAQNHASRGVRGTVVAGHIFRGAGDDQGPGGR